MVKIKSFQADRPLVIGEHTSLCLESINFHKPRVVSAAQVVFAVAFLPASAALHLQKIITNGVPCNLIPNLKSEMKTQNSSLKP